MMRSPQGLGAALLCAALAAPALGTAEAATILVNNNLTASETWTSDNEYILTKPIYVTNGATLSIGRGTVIRGNPESVPGAHDPGTLIITRGSKIRAMGTKDQPIVFTDLLDDNIGSNPGTFPYDRLDNALGTTAQWGGVILLGRAYVANNTLSGPDPTREFQIEGLDPAGGLGLYGNGGNDDDDSGVMTYVSIRYGGFNLSANNEINGLTLGAVGRSTTIDYIDVMQTKDDFVECFGGTVNLKHIVGVNGGDDGLDTDEGYRGKVQYLFVVQGTPGADKNDKGGEWDGGNNPDGSQPFAVPTIYNATFVGLGQKSYTGKLTNLGAVYRDNAGGRLYNSFFADFGGAPILVEGGTAQAIEPNTSAERATTPYVIDNVFYKAPASAFQLEMQNDEWWCMGNGGTVPTGDATALGGVAGQIHYDPGVFSNAALNNHYRPCTDPLPIRALVRRPNGIPSAPDPIAAIDPRPVPGGILATSSRTAPADGFFEPVAYIGAFDTNNNWAAGWTTMARLGYFPPPPQVDVTGNLTASTTWTRDTEWILTKPIYVTNGATLSIEPGTVIRGNPESVPGAHDPGTLIITRGSKIRAMGTKDQPIVFTDLLDDNFGPNKAGTFPYDRSDHALGTTAQWGGVILLGRAYVANNTLSGPDPTREFQIEGLDPAGGLGLYGNGGNDDDDSGVMTYVSIRYGGFNLSANNEINGLTLGAVGRSTTIDYIDVMQTKDDFVECFGGTVNLKHIVGVNGGDDGLDTDEGYRGKVQYLFVLQGTPGADKNDKGGEWDGGNNPDGSQPFATPTIYNATFVGLGQKSYAGKLTNLGAVYRDNAGGRLYNSFFADFGGAPVLVEGGTAQAIEPNTSAERATTPYVTDNVFYKAPASAFQLEMQNDEWWCMGNGGTVPTGDATALGGVAGQIHYDPGVFSNAALSNHYRPCTDPLPMRRLSRGTAASTVPDPIAAIDPRPLPSSVLLAGARSTPADGFFEPAAYRGAFGPGSDWVNGWSTMSRLGYIAKCDPASQPDALPDEVAGLIVPARDSVIWSAASFNTPAYDVVRSTTPANFTTGICVEKGDIDTAAADPVAPAVGQIFFYQVRGRNACGVGPLGYATGGAEEAGPVCP